MVSSDIRQRYVEEIRTNAKVSSTALLQAFAEVPREEFVGHGPWKVLSRPPGHTQAQVAEVADPAELYRDVAVLLDPSRSLTNGNPGTLAPWLDALNLSKGKSVFHLGCGTGYYTAVMAEAVGPTGRVTAVFAFCAESGLRDDYKQTILKSVIAGEARVFTDPLASPTHFPFKVVHVEGSVSEHVFYSARPRICDLGYLREAYRTPDGTISYRSPRSR